MKKYILLLAAMLILVPLSYADFIVYYETGTKEVKFAGKEKDIVLSDEDKVNLASVIKSGKIEDYGLVEDLNDYKIVNDNFVVNTSKISKRENDKIKDKEKKDKEDADFESAKLKLIDLGLTSDEVDALR